MKKYDEKTLTKAKKKKKLDRQMRLTGRADTGFHRGCSSKLSMRGPTSVSK